MAAKEHRLDATECVAKLLDGNNNKPTSTSSMWMFTRNELGRLAIARSPDLKEPMPTGWPRCYQMRVAEISTLRSNIHTLLPCEPDQVRTESVCKPCSIFGR